MFSNIRVPPDWEGSELIKMHFGSSGEEKRYFYLKPKQNKMYYCESKSRKSKNDED
jgi:hypothetical protein